MLSEDMHRTETATKNQNQTCTPQKITNVSQAWYETETESS